MNRIYFLVGITLCSLLFAACNNGKEKTDAQVKKNDADTVFCLNEQLKVSTKIESVAKRPITEQFTLSGKIEYNENDMAAFKSLLEGVVESVTFELGDYVKQGQVLVTVRSTQIQELDQQKRSLKNQIALLQKQVQSKKALFNDGLIAQPEVLSTEHELTGVKIELERIEQTLSMYKAIGGGRFQIVAPKNGYIIRKNITTGESIATDSEALFAISNLRKVWVMVNIYASNLRFVKTGDMVKVRTVAYPDNLYHGRIDKINRVFDENEHVLKARVVLENQNLNLMPGLSADIIIDKSTSESEAFSIPNEAIIFSNNKEYIVVYENDCKMRIQKITTLAKNETYTFIKESLQPNEKVIGSNALLIFEALNP